MEQTLVLKRAVRSNTPLKLGVSGPSGSGKTLSSLLLAYGLLKEKYPQYTDEKIWEKIAIVDTENGSGELYAGFVVNGVKVGQYNAVTLLPPFEAQKYVNAITLCEEADMEVCIIDSGTHLWSGEGGLLEQQGNIAKRTGNSYTAWRDITPMHSRFVEKMLQSKMNVILTLRSKQEYATEKNESGKTTVKKLGLEPEARKGLEYEFTVFLEIDADHQAFGSKDRTGVLDGKTFTITPKTGRDLMQWLQSGADVSVPDVVKTKAPTVPVENIVDDLKKKVMDICKKYGSSNTDLMNIVREFAPNGNPNTISDEEKLTQLFDKLVEFDAKRLGE